MAQRSLVVFQQAHDCRSPLFLRQQKVERGPNEFVHRSAITDQLRPCGRTLVTVDEVAGERIDIGVR